MGNLLMIFYDSHQRLGSLKMMCRSLLADSCQDLMIQIVDVTGLLKSLCKKQKKKGILHASTLSLLVFFFVYVGKCSAESVVFVGNDVA